MTTEQKWEKVDAELAYSYHDRSEEILLDVYLKRCREAYKSALRKAIEEMIANMTDPFERGYRAALRELLEKLDTVDPE